MHYAERKSKEKKIDQSTSGISVMRLLVVSHITKTELAKNHTIFPILFKLNPIVDSINLKAS